MEPVILSQFEESSQLKKRRQKVDQEYAALLKQLRVFMEAILRGQDPQEAKLFELIAGSVSHVQSSAETWLERVFAADGDAVLEEFLYPHSLHVMILSVVLAEDWDIERDALLILAAAALLHDTGMFQVPRDIIAAPRPLDQDEKGWLYDHPERGRHLLSLAKIRREISDLVFQEHEREDGSGYPQGLMGAEIDLMAKIIGISDCFESVTHLRPHRPARTFVDGFHHLRMSAPGAFPDKLWLAALRRLTPYPPGTRVRLSNGRIGGVIQVHPAHPLHPVVECAAEGPEESGDSVLVDLRRDSMLHIAETRL